MAGIAHLGAHRHLGVAHRGRRGTEIHQTLTVYVLIGIPPATVGSGEKPCGEIRVGDLIAEQMLHHR